MVHRPLCTRPKMGVRRRPRSVAALLAGMVFCSAATSSLASDPRALGLAGAVDQGAPQPLPFAAGDIADEVAVPSAPPAEFAGREGVLALVDGRVVFGTISPAPGGYLLKRRGASDEMVPGFLVQTASDSLTGCYENLRDAVRHPRPDDHLKLADWCLKQKLLDEARTEVVSALQLDPNRREARELLMQLEEALHPKPRHLQSEQAAARRSDGFLESGPKTTEGISPESTSLFVRRIQPLLVSKCGNAACHGGETGGEFRLVNVRRTSSSGRSATLENLREVLGYVDAAEPGRTRLLSALQSPVHAGVFSGVGGGAQEAAIRNWLQAAAGDKGLQPELLVANGAPPVWTRDAIALVAGEETGPGNSGQRATGAVKGAPAAGKGRPMPLQRAERPPQLQRVGGGEALVEKVLKEERADPFDPDEFNRLSRGVRPENPENPR